MIAETIFVGTELLLGQIVNTNAAYLGERLSLLGIDSYYQVVVGDNAKRLAATLSQAIERSDIVITSGGLGPTMDDLTRETIAELTSRALQFDAPLWEYISGRRRGAALPANMRRQAMVPVGATVLPNHVGTAPGLAVPSASGAKLFILLPGPPHELEPIFERHVIPLLLQRMGERTTLVSRSLHFCEIGESPLEDKLHDLVAGQTDPTLATYAKPGDVQLRISTKAASREEGLGRIATVEEQIRSRVSEYLYGVDGATLEAAVGSLLAQLGWRLLVVDAHGGGTLASRLTEPEGSELWFAGGLTAASCEQALSTLERLGTLGPAEKRPSSPDEWSAMLAGLALSLGVDAAVALVPAGNGGTCFTVALRSGRSKTATSGGSGGNRQTWRWRTSQSALAVLRRVAMEALAGKS